MDSDEDDDDRLAMIELTSALKSRVTAHMSRNAMGSTNVISATPPTQPAVAVAAKVVGAAPIGLPTHRLFNLKPAAMQLESTLVVQEFPRSGELPNCDPNQP